jgi:hypothetical protein
VREEQDPLSEGVGAMLTTRGRMREDGGEGNDWSDRFLITLDLD